jgi:hypothetical protein
MDTSADFSILRCGHHKRNGYVARFGQARPLNLPSNNAMTKISLLSVASLALSGCLPVPQPESQVQPNKTQSAVVEFYCVPPKSFYVTNEVQVVRVKGWLREVLPTQLPPEEMGSVVPFCTVTIFQDLGGVRRPIASNDVYRVRDATTHFRLLTVKQCQELLDILGINEDDIQDR